MKSDTSLIVYTPSFFQILKVFNDVESISTWRSLGKLKIVLDTFYHFLENCHLVLM